MKTTISIRLALVVTATSQLACAGPVVSSSMATNPVATVAINRAPAQTTPIRVEPSSSSLAATQPLPESSTIALQQATTQARARDDASLLHALEPSQMRALLAQPHASTSTSAPADDDDLPSPGWFWGGTIAAGLGAAGLLTTGTIGYVHTRRVADGYANGMSHAELDDHVTAGERANKLAAVSATIGIVGLVVAAATYGVHYSRCGSLAAKRRTCN